MAFTLNTKYDIKMFFFHFPTFPDISRHFPTFPDISRHFPTFPAIPDISRRRDLAGNVGAASGGGPYLLFLIINICLITS